MTSESPPKSYDREGGERVKLARYARYFGIFLFCVSVAAWVSLVRRPAVPDALVADAVEWAESAPSIPCERPGMDGEVANGCTTERRDDAWLDRRAREVRDGGGRAVLLEALQQVDDRLRGPQPDRPLDSESLVAAGFATSRRGEPVDDALLERARALPDTAPTPRDYLIASAAAFIKGPLERGRVVSSQHPHARAEVVALARIARRAEACDSFECLLSALEVVLPEPASTWQSLLMGPRAEAADRIARAEMHWRDTYVDDLRLIRNHRRSLRRFAGVRSSGN